MEKIDSPIYKNKYLELVHMEQYIKQNQKRDNKIVSIKEYLTYQKDVIQIYNNEKNI